jgi:hypothetical protein
MAGPPQDGGAEIEHTGAQNLIVDGARSAGANRLLPVVGDRDKLLEAVFAFSRVNGIQCIPDRFRIAPEDGIGFLPSYTEFDITHLQAPEQTATSAASDGSGRCHGTYVNAAQTADIEPYPPRPMLTFI